MTVTLTLGKPVKAHDTEMVELTFREPTVEEVMQIGLPQLLIPSADGTSVAVEVRPKILGQYIVKLAGIPLSAVKQLSLADFSRCQGVVMGFFGEADGETPSN